MTDFLFRHIDSDGDRLEVGGLKVGSYLFVTAEDGDGYVQVQVDRGQASDLYEALGRWLGEPGRVEATEPEPEPEPEPERTFPASANEVSKMIWDALRLERESASRFVESKLEEALAVDRMPDAWRGQVEQVAGQVARDELRNALTAAVREVN